MPRWVCKECNPHCELSVNLCGGKPPDVCPWSSMDKEPRWTVAKKPGEYDHPCCEATEEGS